MDNVYILFFGLVWFGSRADAACCGDGWMSFKGSCYLFADETSVDWTEGTHLCAAHDSTPLVIIDSRDEEMFLRDHSQRLFKGTLRNGVWFWIGATDDVIEGVWTWYTNNKNLSDGYVNWFPGQPATGDKDNQDCACLYGQSDFTWHDCHCEQKSHVICEKNLTLNEGTEIIG